MKTLRERLTQAGAWSDQIMGNHALARAIIDTGTQIITTFPGSPVPEIATALNLVEPAKRTYYFEYSTNEKVALEVAAGASLNGHLSSVFFKSVGLNVAADSLIQLGLMELIGGMVVILGDDPGANSSQNEQDNRWFARMSYIPMLEPASPQEAYDYYREAVRISTESNMPVFLRMTTHICHARQVVEVQPIASAKPDWTPRFDSANGPYVPIAKDVFPLKRRALEKLDKLREDSDSSALNVVLSPNGPPPANSPALGVISYGLNAMSVVENLHESDTPIDVLKLGLTHPLPGSLVTGFLRDHDEVLILEDLDRVLEGEVKSLAWDSGLDCKLHVRRGIDDLMGELGPARTWNFLAGAWPDLFNERTAPTPSDNIPPRLPQMCPGCGHRSAFHAVAQALEDTAITVGDIGCHTMGYMYPYNMGEVLFSMGHGVSTASGMSIGNDQRQVLTFIGDATLYHAGLPGIVNAAAYDHNITLVLMENGTTAMTGHQPSFGSGEVGDKIKFATLLETLGVKFIREVDAYNQEKLIAHLKDALAYKGFAMVIAKHSCMLKFTREQRKRMPEFSMPHVDVDQNKCERLHDCVAVFGCPSFNRSEDGQVTVNEDLCIGDGSCLQTCPVSAIWRPKPGGAQ